MASVIFSLLIVGASHAGKTALGAALGEATCREVFSTDQMARHPGRPWPLARPHVAEFYTALSDRSIHQFLLNHHENMWPHIKRKLLEHQASEHRSIFEGSALRPEYIATLSKPQNKSICLHADAGFLRDRIYQDSAYVERSADHRFIIDKFVNRTIIDNKANFVAAKSCGIECIDVSDTDALEEAKGRLIAQLDD